MPKSGTFSKALRHGANDHRVRQLTDACGANDSQRLRQLLDSGSITRADATASLDSTLAKLPLMRMLLEHGADPAACAIPQFMKRSIDLVKLLVDFGYDIKINGHCILQDYADSRESIDWLLDHGVDITSTDHERTDSGFRPGQCHDYSLKVLNNVAANGDIAFFDYLVRCKDSQMTVAMIDHLLDVHHMDIEANNEYLRDFFHASGDSGTPLNCAVFYHNLAALNRLLERGANPSRALYPAISNFPASPWLPAIAPLIHAGGNPDDAFAYAVDELNFEAAKICLDEGADPAKVLRTQQTKAEKKASGSYDRYADQELGDGGFSTDDDDELALERKKMREFVKSACDAQSAHKAIS